MLLAGVSIMHFAHALWFLVLGVACLPLGVFSILFGVWRYRRMDRHIRLLRKDVSAAPAGGPERPEVLDGAE